MSILQSQFFNYPVGLSITVSEILLMFYFPLKSKMAVKSGENYKFTPLHMMVLHHHVAKNSLKIAQPLIVFKTYILFYFPLKSKMAAKSGEN